MSGTLCTGHRLSKKSTACVDGGASSPARCRASNFQFEPRQFRPQGETAESCGFCASCHPLQFPLKSFGFPGAETARKRFLLWEMGFPGAKISTRARRACRRARFLCERAEALSRSPRAVGAGGFLAGWGRRDLGVAFWLSYVLFGFLTSGPLSFGEAGFLAHIWVEFLTKCGRCGEKSRRRQENAQFRQK